MLLSKVWLTLLKIARLRPTSCSTPWATMHNIYFSVSSAEIVGILEGSAENMASLEMVTMSTGTFTSIDAKEVIDSKSMTAAMETANKVVSAYQAPNQ